MKRLFFLAVFLCLSIYSTYGTDAPMPGEYIKVALLNNNKPYEFLDDNNNLRGFTVDLTFKILDRIHQPFKVEVMNFYEALEKVKTGEIDLICSIVITNDREKICHYSNPYIPINYHIIYRKNTKISSITDIKNKKVIVDRGGVAEMLLMKKKNEYNNELIPVSNMQSGLSMLSSGVGDIALSAKSNTYEIMKVQNINNLCVYSAGFPEEEFCYGSKNMELIKAINEELTVMMDDGSYDNIYGKWFSMVKQSNLSTTLIYICILLSLIAIIFIIVSIRLKKKLKATSF